MSKHGVRDRILEAAIAMLRDTDDPTTITVSQIAEQAEVGAGSINYNFGSKDALLSQAIWHIVGEVAGEWYTGAGSDVDARTRLKLLFKGGLQAMLQYPAHTRMGIQQVLKSGDMQAHHLILPLLRDIFGDTRPEIELRLIAFQMNASFRVAFLNLRELGDFLGLDVSTEAAIDTITDTIIDNLIGSEKS